MSIQNNFPTIKPTLLLDFANTRSLDPRITFARASTATFYDDKTTAVAEQNLLLQSQTFGTTWITANGTLTTGILDPISGTTATTLTATSANATVYETVTLLALPYTISFYVQRVTGTGTVNLTLDGTNFTAITVTGSWVRYSATVTPTAGSKTVGIQLVTSGDAVNIWGAQLEQRSTVSSYTPTTTQTITNYIPVLQTAASGVARFDCNPVTRESLGLLIEESRTNLFTYSDDFSNAAWAKTNSTITANTIVSPDGTLDADKLVETATTNLHYISQTPTTGTSDTFTLTCYAKAAERRIVELRIGDVGYSSGSRVYATFDLSTGTVGTIGSVTATNTSQSIASVGNGFYRISVTATLSVTSTTTLAFVSLRTSTSALSAGESYTGDGYSGIYIWGAQLEAGAFPTSYIPTVASQVTRAIDSANMTGTNFSSWYNQSQGTLYAEAALIGATLDAVIASANSNSTANDIRLRALSTNSALAFRVFANGVLEASGTKNNAFTVGQSFKLAGFYQVNNFGFTSGGTTPVVDTLGVLGVETQLQLGAVGGTAAFNGTIKRFAYYPVAISSTELQGLTS